MRLYLIIAAIVGIIFAGSYYMTRPFPHKTQIVVDPVWKSNVAMPKNIPEPARETKINVNPAKSSKTARRQATVTKKKVEAPYPKFYTKKVIDPKPTPFPVVTPSVPWCEGVYSSASGTNFGTCKLKERVSYESPGDSGSAGDSGGCK